MYKREQVSSPEPAHPRFSYLSKHCPYAANSRGQNLALTSLSIAPPVTSILHKPYLLELPQILNSTTYLTSTATALFQAR